MNIQNNNFYAPQFTSKLNPINPTVIRTKYGKLNLREVRKADLANPKFLIENSTKYANDCIKTIYKNYIDREIRDTTAKLADADVDARDKVVLLKKVVDLKKMSLKVPNQIEEK